MARDRDRYIPGIVSMRLEADELVGMIEYRSIGRIKFGGALFVAEVFKVLAALSVVGGVILAFAVTKDASTSDDAAAAVGYVIGLTAVSASTLAFFGFVLEIGVAIFEESWHMRYATAEEEEEEEQDRETDDTLRDDRPSSGDDRGGAI